MQAKLWRKNETLGKYSLADRDKLCDGKDYAIFPVVWDGTTIAAPQPFDPNTGNPWASETEALDWAMRWITANEENAKKVVLEKDTRVLRFS